MRVKVPFCVVLGLFCLVAVSCDLLRTSPFEVVSWSPGSGYYGDLQGVVMSFRFSHDPDRMSVERSLSITADGNTVQGSLLWDGRSVRFSPFEPLRANAEYAITIVSDACDTRGVSLDDTFEVSFFTRAEGDRPRVISIIPADDAVVLDQRAPVVIAFSDPVDALSCRNSIVMSPAMSGSWSVGSDGREAVFVPIEPWGMGVTYTVTVGSGFTNSIGISMGREFKSRFTVGDDKVPPELVGTYGVDGLGTVMVSLLEDGLGGAGTENAGWECSYFVRFDFSEPVRTSSVQHSLAVVSAGGFEMVSAPGFLDSVVFRFTEKPSYLSRFAVTVGAGVEDRAGNKSSEEHRFRFFVDGVRSKPPALVGIRLPLAPGESAPGARMPAVYAAGELFADLPIESGAAKYPFDTAVSIWIELYFDTAIGAGIDLFSIMNVFRVGATNGALSFSFRGVKDSGFSWGSPHGEWASFTRVEVQGRLTNYGSSGVVTIEVGDGVLDTYGNRSDAEVKLVLLK